VKAATICIRMLADYFVWLKDHQHPCVKALLKLFPTRSEPVEGEYCLSKNDRLIRGEIAPGASDKICAALLLAEPLPQPLVE
jgi:hypothetical protein